MENDRVLVVDDEKGIRDQLYWALKEDYHVFSAAESASALQLVRDRKPAVVTLDLSLTGAEDEREGIDLIGRILDVDPTIKIIMITAHGQKENALICIERGAYDFFSKPIDLNELKVVINRALYLHQIEQENRKLQSELIGRDRFEDIIGNSEQIHRVFDFVTTVASSDYTILITGESGTGKELVARAIHHRSPRAEKPFITINCGAIPENLLESELFGYEKGAFTDATAQHVGRLEQGHGGTVFLDEIGELSLKLQVKLLRFLEDRKIERLGGTKAIDLDVRILAATNRNLDHEVAGESFREDLFYRLSVLQLELPPLRERGEDTLYLARYFLSRFSLEQKRKGLEFSSEAADALSRHDWPGNVRELENKIKRAVILAKGKNIQPMDLGLAIPETGDSEVPTTLQGVRERAEREHIERCLTLHNYNISQASRVLEVSRTTLYELMDRYGLKKPQKS